MPKILSWPLDVAITFDACDKLQLPRGLLRRCTTNGGGRAARLGVRLCTDSRLEPVAREEQYDISPDGQLLRCTKLLPWTWGRVTAVELEQKEACHLVLHLKLGPRKMPFPYPRDATQENCALCPYGKILFSGGACAGSSGSKQKAAARRPTTPATPAQLDAQQPQQRQPPPPSAPRASSAPGRTGGDSSRRRLLEASGGGTDARPAKRPRPAPLAAPAGGSAAAAGLTSQGSQKPAPVCQAPWMLMNQTFTYFSAIRLSSQFGQLLTSHGHLDQDTRFMFVNPAGEALGGPYSVRLQVREEVTPVRPTPKLAYRWTLQGRRGVSVEVNTRFRGAELTGMRLMPDCVSVQLRVTETPELRRHVQQGAADAAARAAAAAAVAAAPKGDRLLQHVNQAIKDDSPGGFVLPKRWLVEAFGGEQHDNLTVVLHCDGQQIEVYAGIRTRVSKIGVTTMHLGHDAAVQSLRGGGKRVTAFEAVGGILHVHVRAASEAERAAAARGAESAAAGDDSAAAGESEGNDEGVGELPDEGVGQKEEQGQRLEEEDAPTAEQTAMQAPEEVRQPLPLPQQSSKNLSAAAIPSSHGARTASGSAVCGLGGGGRGALQLCVELSSQERDAAAEAGATLLAEPIHIAAHTMGLRLPADTVEVAWGGAVASGAARFEALLLSSLVAEQGEAAVAAAPCIGRANAVSVAQAQQAAQYRLSGAELVPRLLRPSVGHAVVGLCRAPGAITLPTLQLLLAPSRRQAAAPAADVAQPHPLRQLQQLQQQPAAAQAPKAAATPAAAPAAAPPAAQPPQQLTALPDVAAVGDAVDPLLRVMEELEVDADPVVAWLAELDEASAAKFMTFRYKHMRRLAAQGNAQGLRMQLARLPTLGTQ